MVPWEDQLTPEEMQQVSSYVLTFKGKTAANPKEPQGELTSGSPAPAEAPVTDSTAVVATIE
jgi:cytochrome c oxidase cbb3-type subunit 3